MHVATVPLDQLTRFLRVRGWIPASAAIATRIRLGGGRTATTVRITTTSGATRILRQPGRDMVGDGRFVADPAERIAVEGEFYRLVQPWPAVAERMPTCLGVDRTDHLIALEDLGTAATLAARPAGCAFEAGEIEELTAYLVALHGITADDEDLCAVRSDGVRLARHAERFEAPFHAPRIARLIELAPRLERLVDAVRTDVHVRATMHDLGARFLDGRGCLLHGDFRPARWLPTPGGVRILAPGLATAGPPALDLGFFVAHLLLACQPHDVIVAALQRYRRAAAVDLAEVSACAGLEIIRSRLGASPVPHEPSPARLLAELEYATRLLRGDATVELPL